MFDLWVQEYIEKLKVEIVGKRTFGNDKIAKTKHELNHSFSF